MKTQYFNISIAAWIVAACCSTTGASAELPGPFVAGFDRFYRDSAPPSPDGGRLLIGELRCTACHFDSDPELRARKGPRLDGVGDRYHRDWVERFVADPQAVKPGTNMPQMLGALSDSQRRSAAAALAAFLDTQRQEFPDLLSTASSPIAPEFWRKGDETRGRAMYHQFGCVACHAPEPGYEATFAGQSTVQDLLNRLGPEDLDELGLAHLAHVVRSVPQANLAEKYSSKSLVYFLLDPGATRPSGGMPNFGLRPDEAADLAAYLRRDATSADASVDDADVSLIEQGKQLFQRFRCVHCHELSDPPPPNPASKRLSELELDSPTSCLVGSRRDQPYFPLEPVQRESLLAAFDETVFAARGEPAIESRLGCRLLRMNCYACHERGGRGGVGPQRQAYFQTARHVDLGDEGRLPPPLDHVGRKLREPIIKSILSGTGGVRTHMLARMPNFSNAGIDSLPKEFSDADGFEPASPEIVFGDLRGLAESGRLLMDSGCVQCHPMRGEFLPGVVGVDLAEVTKRIHPDWFREFLLNPAALKPRTRMPTLFPNAKSSIPHILAGDVDRQIAAMWSYLAAIESMPLPQKIQVGKVQNFVLVPTDRPLLLRTFFQDAGTHAIAVGFPEKVHFVFDAEQTRLSLAWRGAFFDAHGTWFDRFAPPAKPLGDDLMTMPPGPPLARLATASQSWPEQGKYDFGGYRLDADGVPTFLYRFGDAEVADRFEPTATGGLARKLVISQHDDSAGSLVWFRVLVGPQLTARGASSYESAAGLRVILADHVAARGTVRDCRDGKEWIVPLTHDSKSEIKVTYEWKMTPQE